MTAVKEQPVKTPKPKLLGIMGGKTGLLTAMEDKLAINLVTTLAGQAGAASKPGGRGRAISRAASGTSLRSHSSGTPSKYSGYSQVDEPLLLHEKLQKYIRRIAATAMPVVYAHRYLREQAKKAIRDAAAARAAQAGDFADDDSAVAGLKATL